MADQHPTNLTTVHKFSCAQAAADLAVPAFAEFCSALDATHELVLILNETLNCTEDPDGIDLNRARVLSEIIEDRLAGATLRDFVKDALAALHRFADADVAGEAEAQRAQG